MWILVYVIVTLNSSMVSGDSMMNTVTQTVEFDTHGSCIDAKEYMEKLEVKDVPYRIDVDAECFPKAKWF